MKLNKIILGAAAFLAGGVLSAQHLSFHGYMDYTNFGIGQQINKSSQDADWDVFDPSAEFGSFYNGRTELRCEGGIGPVSFQTGVRLDASLGEWYNLYKDMSDKTETMFHVANIRVSMWQDQLILHTGKFEEWNCGFLADAEFISPLAERGYGQHMTGLEWIPNMNVFGGKLTGFRMYAGLPILPSNFADSNEWSTLWHKTKIMASYRWLRPNIIFHAGYHNEYYTGRKEDWLSDYTKSFYREAFIQADMPSLVRNFKMVATYDLRWRTADYDFLNPVDESVLHYEDVTTAHYIGFKGEITAIPAYPITVVDRFFYADDHYIEKNEKAFANLLEASVSHKIAGTDYTWGIKGAFRYAQDANGGAFESTSGDPYASYEPNSGENVGGVPALHSDWMAGPKVETAGAATRYMVGFAYPYFEKTFSNGYFRTGVEFQYMNVSNENVTGHGINYRVPFAFCFWF